MAQREIDTPSSLKETARAHLQQAADETRHTVKRELREHAEGVRDTAAAETRTAANAAHAAAREFDAGTLQAQAASQVADALEQVAAQVRTTDLDRLARTVGGFARDNPALFVGGAALLGLAATRFLKARDPHAIPDHEPQDTSQPAGSDDVWTGSTYGSPASRGAA